MYYRTTNMNSYPYYGDSPMNYFGRQPINWSNTSVHGNGKKIYNYSMHGSGMIQLKDYGPAPHVININEATKQNSTYRTAIWTGKHLQVTLMSLNIGEDIGLEMHPNLDQFLRIEQGQGIVLMGKSRTLLNYQQFISDDTAIMVPAGTWHNVINTGNIPLRLYSIYAPPEHPRGTVHVTKADAIAAE